MMSRNSSSTMANLFNVTGTSLQQHPFCMLFKIKSRSTEHAIGSLYPSPTGKNSSPGRGVRLLRTWVALRIQWIEATVSPSYTLALGRSCLNTLPTMTWGEMKGRGLPTCKSKRAGGPVTSRPKVPGISPPLYSPLLPPPPFHGPPTPAFTPTVLRCC